MSEFLREEDDELEPEISYQPDHMEFLLGGGGLPACPTQATLESFVKTHVGKSFERRVITLNGEQISIVGENQGKGIGKIFFGYRESDKKLVALRVLKDHMLDEETQQRFLYEQEFLRARNFDPVRYWSEFYGVGEFQNRLNGDSGRVNYKFSCVEFLLGKDIGQLIGDSRKFVRKPQVALAIAMQLCHALSFYEGEGYVIRDLDPLNVMITRPTRTHSASAPFSPFVRLFDANLLWQRRRNLTPPGIVYGKLRYIAPERARSQSYDHRLDIYSIGSTLYEMLAGRKVYTIEDQARLLLQVREGVFPPPISDHEELTDIVFRFLNANPAYRPSTGDSARRLLRDYYAAHYTDDPLTQFIGPAFTQP